MQIEIKITQKRAELQGSCVLVCGNSGDTVKFIFDNEWGQYSNKTARFGFIKEGAWYYSDVLFDGSVCEIPMLSGIDFLEVGVYAGNLSTTTPARVPTKRSILCRNGLEHEPPPADVYNEILAAVSGKLSTTGGTVTGDYYKDGNTFIHEGNLDLLDNAENVSITKTVTGSALTIESANAPFNNLKVLGKTTQDGTPTPDNPIDLVSVGDSGSYEVGVYGKNLLPNRFKVGNTYPVNGINYYINTDGSISVSGTPTSTTNWSSLDARHFLGGNALFVLPKGRYKYVCEGMKDPSKLYPTLYRIDASGTAKEFTKLYKITETIFEITNEKDTLYLLIGCVPNYTPQGESLYISIVPESVTDLSYEPYNKQSLTLTDTLRVFDEIDFARGIKTEKAFVKVFSGGEYFQPCTTTGGGYYFQYANNSIKLNGSNWDLSGAVCNRLVEKTTEDLWRANEQGFSLSAISPPIRLRIDGITTVAELQAKLKEWYDEGNPLTMIVPSATPTETPLTEQELNAYRQLMTNKGTTTVLNSEGADTEITYYVNKPNAQAIGNIHSIVNRDYLKLQQAIITLGGSTL